MAELDMLQVIREVKETLDEKLIRVMVKNDEDIMRLLESFHEEGVEWETIIKALITWSDKAKKEEKKND